jgi:phosphoribosylformylglycinamidine synthase
VRRALLLGFVAAGVALAVYLVFFRSSHERRIRARLDQLADAVRVDGDELSPLPRAARIRDEFAEIFTEDARATVADIDEGLEGRDALVVAAIQAGAVYPSVEVTFDDVNVRIDDASAEVKTTATMTGETGGQNNREERRVTFQLKRTGGDWRIVSAIVAPRRTSGE